MIAVACGRVEAGGCEAPRLLCDLAPAQADIILSALMDPALFLNPLSQRGSDAKVTFERMRGDGDEGFFGCCRKVLVLNEGVTLQSSQPEEAQQSHVIITN